MTTPCRVTFVQTHPIQYMAPWFRYIAEHRPDVELTVLYGSMPTADQQGVGFGESFSWDVALLEGYRYSVLSAPAVGRRFDSESFTGVDVSGLDETIAALHAAMCESTNDPVIREGAAVALALLDSDAATSFLEDASHVAGDPVSAGSARFGLWLAAYAREQGGPPGDTIRLMNRAIAHSQAENWPTALAACTELVAAAPGDGSIEGVIADLRALASNRPELNATIGEIIARIQQQPL
jgi:hypothetical protein